MAIAERAILFAQAIKWNDVGKITKATIAMNERNTVRIPEESPPPCGGGRGDSEPALCCCGSIAVLLC